MYIVKRLIIQVTSIIKYTLEDYSLKDIVTTWVYVNI